VGVPKIPVSEASLLQSSSGTEHLGSPFTRHSTLDQDPACTYPSVGVMPSPWEPTTFLEGISPPTSFLILGTVLARRCLEAIFDGCGKSIIHDGSRFWSSAGVLAHRFKGSMKAPAISLTGASHPLLYTPLPSDHHRVTVCPQVSMSTLHRTQPDPDSVKW